MSEQPHTNNLAVTAEPAPVLGLDDGQSVATGQTQQSREYSARLLSGLARTSEMLHADTPGFIGMTVFGSTVRGQAKPGSDVDLWVLMDPTIPLEDDRGYTFDMSGDFKKRAEGVHTGTYDVSFVAEAEYRHWVRKHLAQNGIDKSDVIILPLTTDILADCVTDLLAVATEINQNTRQDVRCARNVRALFHVPVEGEALQPYIEQTLTALSAHPDGETAWQIIRSGLVTFERPKDQQGLKGVNHRYIPANLEEARGYYLRQP